MRISYLVLTNQISVFLVAILLTSISSTSGVYSDRSLKIFGFLTSNGVHPSTKSLNVINALQHQ